MKHTGCLTAQNNCYTFFRLAKKLLAHGLLSMGTVKPERKDIPQMVKANEKLERDESMFLTKAGVDARKWMDNKTYSLGYCT